ncbi:MAG: TAXI family TRAP transporter solute-binding subunit [Zoogloeaceae bacterium]|nr:TAXI family TRAP transporter solute-binding subunit [Rhodocyclaceae bacterium]MCP5237014.1 TAXI family TRAP transporter solute-binding subunit [Zoogloeaceae bacterium]
MKLLKSLLVGVIALATLPAIAEQKFVTVLTGGTSGVYYPMGVAMSQLFGTALPNAKVSVQSTKASAENVNLLQANRGEVAFALGDTVSYAWHGNTEVGFKKPLDKLRAMAAIYPNFVQIVASKDSGIRTLADLKGKRVSVGAPKSGTELNARAVFQAAGLSYDDLGKVEYLPFGESVELIKNRQLDATLQSAGLGVASIRDLATSIDIVVVPIPDDVVKAIGDSAYQAGVIPAGTYGGQDADVPTAAIRNILVTHAGVEEAAVYEMTKAIFTNLDALVAAHSAAKGIQADSAARALPIPLHPGAERYYREAGLLE